MLIAMVISTQIDCGCRTSFCLNYKKLWTRKCSLNRYLELFLENNDHDDIMSTLSVSFA